MAPLPRNDVASLSVPRSRPRPAAIAGVVAVSLAWWAGAAAPADADVPPPAAGWTTVFADDFDGAANSGVNLDHWQYTTGTSYPGGPANFGTGEIETMTSDPRNVSLDGHGNLRITPVRDAGGAWTSGRIETRRTDFQPPADGKLRVEARMQLPNVTGAQALGYWPAFWMLGAPYRGNWWNWPSVGEIDILENIQGFNNAWATFHCGIVTGGPCNEKDGISAHRPCAPTTCQAGFHTYAVEWDRSGSVEELRWYLDGVHFHTVRSTQVDATTWQNAMNHGYFLILNVAIGGEFPAKHGGGPTAQTASGHPLVVDYVSVRTAGGSGAPPSPPTPGNPPAPSDPPTPDPGQPGGRDARAPIQAESYDAQSGLAVQDAGGTRLVAGGATGDWASYRGVRFGSTPATQFVARVASGVCCGRSGLVEVRLDSRSNPPVATFAIADTGGWHSWRTVPANMAAVTGVHDVYLTLTSGQPADFVNVDWLIFR